MPPPPMARTVARPWHWAALSAGVLLLPLLLLSNTPPLSRLRGGPLCRGAAPAGAATDATVRYLGDWVLPAAAVEEEPPPREEYVVLPKGKGAMQDYHKGLEKYLRSAHFARRWKRLKEQVRAPTRCTPPTCPAPYLRCPPAPPCPAAGSQPGGRHLRGRHALPAPGSGPAAPAAARARQPAPSGVVLAGRRGNGRRQLGGHPARVCPD